MGNFGRINMYASPGMFPQKKILIGIAINHHLSSIVLASSTADFSMLPEGPVRPFRY